MAPLAPGRVWRRRWREYRQDAAVLLDAAFPLAAVGERPIVLKPNLVEAQPPPVTTPAPLVAAVIHWLQERLPGHEVVVAEGCSGRDDETGQVFAALGYDTLAREYGVRLVDLNHEEPVAVDLAGGLVWSTVWLPRLVLDGFLVSLPVLKAHSLAGVTLTMKNMMGCAPPARYQRPGHWKKSAFHEHLQEALFDLNRCRTPDFTLLDATQGMAQAHLWGPRCQPPPGVLLAATDPVAVDAHGCLLLGRDWQGVGHIRLAHGVLGRAVPLAVTEVEHGG